MSWYGTDYKWGGRSWCIRSEAPSADAKKADGARLEALRNPRPPEPTGRVACNQDGSVVLIEIDIGDPGNNGHHEMVSRSQKG